MRIGILSDSHGRADRTACAVRMLREADAERLVHLGDIETEAVLEELLALPAHIVFGNCDLNHNALADHARRLGIVVDDPIGRMVCDGRTITFTHGHKQHLIDAALADGADYLLHGHTHQVRDERIDSTRVINPGALHRARVYTVAILDAAADAVTFLKLE